MKYTIAIPTYNNESTIVKSVLSAINQDFDRDFEVLVVNNFSQDNTLEVLMELKNKFDFRILNNKETVSLFENHNICLREAKGEYVLFCHSDDVLYDDALSKIDEQLSIRSYPKRIVCWGRSFFRDFSFAYSQVANLNDMVSGISVQEVFQYGGLTPSGTCYSRESFVQSGGFLPMKDKITPSDMTSMIKYSLDGAEFLMLDRILFKREFASTAHGITQEERYKSIEHAIEELAKVLPPNTMEILFHNIKTFKTFNLEYMLILSKYCSHCRGKKKLKAKFVFNHPLALRNNFTLKLLLQK